MTDVPLPPEALPKARELPPQPPRDLLTPAMMDALAKTRPWVRFLGILGYVMVGIMILAALGMGGVGVWQSATTSPAVGLPLAGMAVVYLLMAVVYIFPSRFLLRYAKSIREATETRAKSQAVEQALRHQKSFWKFAGIATLVMLIFYPLIIAAIAVPNLLTAMARSKQKRSMADIRTIATVLEAYAIDEDTYPQVSSLDELAPLVEPKYLKKLPRLDGWGHPIRYEAAACQDRVCSSYFLASAGGDGKHERERPSAFATAGPVTTKKFDNDIVYSDGKFVQWPEGVQGN